MSARLDRDLMSLDREDWAEVARLLPAVYAFYTVVVWRDDRVSLKPEELDFFLEVVATHPHPIRYYRQRAEAEMGRWELAERLAASRPFL
jgi:hypothetical protein